MATSNTAIKITSLPNIGNNIAPTTLIPVVNMAGVPTTQKANLQIAGNLILAGAGGANFVPAALANLAYTVVNSNQSNITRVGTLNINTLKVSGGTNGQYLQTDGAGNLSWTTGSGGGGNGTPGGSNTQIQFNDAGNFGGNSGFTFNKTAGALASPLIDTAAVYHLAGTIIENADLSHGATSALVIPANGNTTNPAQLNNFYGNVVVTSGTDADHTKTWTFDNTGNLKLPGVLLAQASDNGSIIFSNDGANTNGYLKVDGGLNMVVSANSNFYVKSAGTDRIAITNTTSDIKAMSNVTIQSNIAGTNSTWKFDTTGNLILPGDIVGPANANVIIYANAGVHQFTFGDDGTFYAPDNVVLGGSSIAIGPGANTLTGITNAVFIASSNSSAYIQAAITNVSDIGSADWAAYGHHGDDNGGWIDVGFNSSGYSSVDYTITGPGDGSLLVESYYDGQAPGGRGGNLIIGTGSQGTVNDIIFVTGGFLIENEFARISDSNNSLELTRTGASITFPDNTVQTTAYTGGGGSTGNVTFDNVVVQGVNGYAGGLGLSASPEDTANLKYLQVRAGDVDSHIHFDTGNNLAYDQYFGDDNKYVKLANTGNVTISAYQDGGPNAQWTFSYDGNLTVPGNIQSKNIGFMFSGTITGIESFAYPTPPIITIAESVFSDSVNGIVVISNLNPTTGALQANGTWYYLAVEANQFTLYTDAALTQPVDTSDWTAYEGPGGDVATINEYADFSIQGGNVTIGSNLKDWVFDSNGDINIPPRAGSFDYGRIQSANGYPTLLGYGTDGTGGPELDWANTDNPNDIGNANVIRNTMYINNSGLTVIMNANEVANTFSGRWNFDNYGGTIFPTLNVQRGDNPSGTIQGQTLLFGDAAQEAIISTPDGVAGAEYSQRLVINPGQGYNYGEGGDIYLWAGRGGDGSGSGGDIKIRGGQGGANTTGGNGGDGGYIRIEAGDTATTGGYPGYVTVVGGNSATIQGGYVEILGGRGATIGGDANLKGGYGTATGGNVNIWGGGSGNGQPNEGNVNIQTGGHTWTYDPSGNLTLPGSIIGSGNLYIAPDSNNTSGRLDIFLTVGPDIHIAGVGENLILGRDDTANVTVGVDGNVYVQAFAGGPSIWTYDYTGNLILPQGGIVHETSIPFGGLTGNTIALKPSGGTNADQQLLVYPTAGGDNNHLHLTSGNLLNTELFLGNDDFYVKLANTGNIVINTNDSVGNTAQWVFDTTGTILTPGDFIVETPSGIPATVTAITGSSGSWESNPTSNLATTGGTGTGLTVDVSQEGGYAGAIAIHTPGTGYSNGDAISVVSGSSSASFTISVVNNQWTFGTNGVTTNPVILFANLPLATTPGLRAFISDGNLAPIGNFGVEVSGGGGNYVPVFSDGANWCIG